MSTKFVEVSCPHCRAWREMSVEDSKSTQVVCDDCKKPFDASKATHEPIILNKPRSSAWSMVGGITLILSVLVIVAFCMKDTGIQGDEGRVVNLSLMHKRSIGMMIGCCGFIGGLIMVGLGTLSNCRAYLVDIRRIALNATTNRKTDQSA